VTDRLKRAPPAGAILCTRLCTEYLRKQGAKWLLDLLF